MTLLLLWKNGDEITVIADTLFGGGHGEGSAIGPKIFPVPIAITDLGEAKRKRYPIWDLRLPATSSQANSHTRLRRPASKTLPRQPRL